MTEFMTTDGRLLYKPETNKHHLFWRRDSYRTPTERKFRDTTGLVLRMTIKEHKELHANVRPPEKPNSDLMRDVIHFARGLEDFIYYDRYQKIAGYLIGVVENGSDQNANDAAMVLANFEEQDDYLTRGRLTIIRHDGTL
jgi:hypothetical protein